MNKDSYSYSSSSYYYYYYCTIDVKMELFRSYCSSLYCCSMWSDYRKASYKKMTVAFDNVHRRMHNLPWRCSASAMYVNYNLPNLDTVIRRNLFGFIQRLSISHNSIIRALEHSWHIKIKHWDCWTKILYLIMILTLSYMCIIYLFL